MCVLPWKNTPQYGLHSCQLQSKYRTQKAPHQNTRSCDPGRVLPVDTDSDSISGEKEKKIQMQIMIKN